MKTSDVICTDLGKNYGTLSSFCPSFPLGPAHTTGKFIVFANI